jgi:hypothetical protein
MTLFANRAVFEQPFVHLAPFCVPTPGYLQISFVLSIPEKLNYTEARDNGIERVRVLHICPRISTELPFQTKAPFKYLTKQLKFQFAQSRPSVMN